MQNGMRAQGERISTGLELKNELGEKLYYKVVGMIWNSENKEAFQKFDKINLEKIEHVYEKYKNLSVWVLPLFNFLSLHSLYNPGYQSLFRRLCEIKKHSREDVTKVLDPLIDLEEYRKLHIL